MMVRIFNTIKEAENVNGHSLSNNRRFVRHLFWSVKCRDDDGESYFSGRAGGTRNIWVNSIVSFEESHELRNFKGTIINDPAAFKLPRNSHSCKFCYRESSSLWEDMRLITIK